MSTTDDSFSVTHDPIEIQRPSLKERWWHIMDTWKIGIIPLPLFVLAGALIAIDCLGGKLPSDIVVMVATLAFFGFACGEFGKRLPIVGKLGAAAGGYAILPENLSTEALAIAFRKGNPQLKQRVDSTLAGLERSGAAEQLYLKWYGPGTKSNLSERHFKIDSDRIPE